MHGLIRIVLKGLIDESIDIYESELGKTICDSEPLVTEFFVIDN